MQDVFDEIVGFVRLDQSEDELFQHPLLTRLGGIKQLGLASMTFPGANHTRLSHSLGTLHYAGEIADALIQSKTGNLDDPVAFRRLTRVAGLLHDIGHTPLSHTLEHHFVALYKREANASVVEGETTGMIRYHPVIKEVNKAVGPNKNPFDNSVLSSVLVARSSLSDILTKRGFSPEDIAKVISGQMRPEYYSQILDAGLDADKIDYLQRDKHGTGVPYASFDVHQILKFMKIEDDRIIIDGAAANACLHFLLIRYFWYAQVILNRNVHAFEEMATRIYDSLASIGLLPTPTQILDRLKEIVDRKAGAESLWAEFDDRAFLSAMVEAKHLDGRSREGKPPSPLSSKDLLAFISKVENRTALPCAVRIDAVEVPRKKNGEVTYENQNPRWKDYEKFVEWLYQEKKEEIAKGHIIVSPQREISVTKPREKENPILIKTKHDKEPKTLQEHYYTGIIAGDFPELPIKFTANRVFCMDELLKDLEVMWQKFAKES